VRRSRSRASASGEAVDDRAGAFITPPPRGGAYRPLSDAHRDRIVDHAFEILATVGMADAPADTAAVLEAAGAGRRDDGRLTFDRGMVEAAMARSPSTVDLPGFVVDRGSSIGGGRVHVGAGGAAVQVLDADTGAYRDSTLADLATVTRVLDHCSNVHYGVRLLVARDMPDDLALDVNTAFACLASTTKPFGVSFTSAATVDPVVDLFDQALGAPGAFAVQPFCMAVAVHVVSPLRFSGDGCEVIARAVQRGMVVQTCSAAQAGATSPASLAGALAQGLAEILAGVVLVDALRPGHPAIHAFLPFVADLRTGAMTGGGGEQAVAAAAAAQIMNDLSLPHAVSAGMTDAKVADVQAGYEKGYTAALAAQAGADMVQLSVGMLASIMVASPEVLVIDDEMCGAVLRSVRGVELDADALDIDALAAAATGDGHFLGQDQTLARMRTEYVYPTLGDRSSVAEWLENGSPTVWARARARVDDIVAAGRPGHLPRSVEAAIRATHGIHLPEER